jgi:hypothetical protein
VFTCRDDCPALAKSRLERGTQIRVLVHIYCTWPGARRTPPIAYTPDVKLYMENRNNGVVEDDTGQMSV